MTMFYNQLPSIDLHGYDRDYARIVVNEFIEDQYRLKKQEVVIIHGNGTGILKATIKETLSRNKYVKDFKICNFNTGMTIVTLKNNY